MNQSRELSSLLSSLITASHGRGRRSFTFSLFSVPREHQIAWGQTKITVLQLSVPRCIMPSFSVFLTPGLGLYCRCFQCLVFPANGSSLLPRKTMTFRGQPVCLTTDTIQVPPQSEGGIWQRMKLNSNKNVSE